MNPYSINVATYLHGNACDGGGGQFIEGDGQFHHFVSNVFTRLRDENLGTQFRAQLQEKKFRHTSTSDTRTTFSQKQDLFNIAHTSNLNASGRHYQNPGILTRLIRKCLVIESHSYDCHTCSFEP